MELLDHRLAENGFLLVIPVLLWNAVFWPRLPESAGGTGTVPRWLQSAETVLRAGVFLAPLLLTIRLDGPMLSGGAILYVAGLLVYFSSWTPWLQRREMRNVALLIGPYLTPIFVFGGIAVVCSSPLYLGVAVAFVGAHVSSGLFKAGLL